MPNDSESSTGASGSPDAPLPDVEHSGTANAGDDASPTGRRRTARAYFLLLAISLGAGIGFYLSKSPGIAVVGGLLGLLATQFRRSPRPSGSAPPGRFPQAHLCVALSTGAWLVVLASLIFAIGSGLLGGEGSSLVLIFILPWLLIFWLIGGPMSTQAGRVALEQIRSGVRPASDLPLARRGLAMGRALTILMLSMLGILLLLIMT